MFLVLSLKLTEKTHFVAHNCFPYLSVETEIKNLGGQFNLRIEFGVSFSSLFFACCFISVTHRELIIKTMVTPCSLFECESFNELKRECTRDEQVDLDLLTLRVLKDLILFLPKKPSLPLTSEEKKLQYRFKPTWGSFQRKRSNLGSSKPHTHYQLPNLNVKRKRFSQSTGIADPELKASLLPEGFACTAPKIITRLKIIPPKKPHLGISAASSIAVSNHSESLKPTPPRVIDGLNCQGLKLVTQKPKKATREDQIEEKPPKKPKLNPTFPLSNPSPKLPQNFQNIIDTMGGTQLVLVIQKPLTKTDLNRHNARLSMPLSQINGSFLREAERVYLDQQQAMEVPFMEPSSKVNKIVLRQWDMPKESGKKSSCYVMIKSWNEVVEKNDLGRKLHQVIQIWSFRVGNEDQLCLAFVVVNTGENSEGASSSSRQGRDRD